MSGGGKTVRSGVQATDDGRGDFIPGEKACTGTVNAVRGLYGARVDVSPSTDAALEVNKREAALGNNVPWQRTIHI